MWYGGDGGGGGGASNETVLRSITAKFQQSKRIQSKQLWIWIRNSVCICYNSRDIKHVLQSRSLMRYDIRNICPVLCPILTNRNWIRWNIGGHIVWVLSERNGGELHRLETMSMQMQFTSINLSYFIRNCVRCILRMTTTRIANRLCVPVLLLSSLQSEQSQNKENMNWIAKKTTTTTKKTNIISMP